MKKLAVEGYFVESVVQQSHCSVLTTCVYWFSVLKAKQVIPHSSFHVTVEGDKVCFKCMPYFIVIRMQSSVC